MQLIFSSNSILPPETSSFDPVTVALNDAEWANYGGKTDIALDTTFRVMNHLWQGRPINNFGFSINGKKFFIVKRKVFYKNPKLCRIHLPKYGNFFMVTPTRFFGYTITVPQRVTHMRVERHYHFKLKKVTRKAAFDMIEDILNLYEVNAKKPRFVDNTVMRAVIQK